MLSLAVAAEVTMGWSQVRDWARTAVASNEYSDMGGAGVDAQLRGTAVLPRRHCHASHPRACQGTDWHLSCGMPWPGACGVAMCWTLRPLPSYGFCCRCAPQEFGSGAILDIKITNR